MLATLLNFHLSSVASSFGFPTTSEQRTLSGYSYIYQDYCLSRELNHESHHLPTFSFSARVKMQLVDTLLFYFYFSCCLSKRLNQLVSND